MAKLQALIFDVDGTIADTEQNGHRLAFNRAFTEAGLDWQWSAALYQDLLNVAGGKERIRYYLTQYNPDFKSPADIEQFIAKLHAAKSKHYQHLIAQGIPLRPGIKRLLQEARSQQIRLAIATTTDPHNVTALLQHSLAPDAPQWFEVIAAGDIVPLKKPAPDIYQCALQALQLPASVCLALEDSYNGLQSARQTGLNTVITVNDHTQEQDFSGALLVLDHLGEPERPFTVLRGKVGGKHYFDIELAQFLLQTL